MSLHLRAHFKQATKFASKPSDWYQNHYPLVPSISPPNLPRLYRKSSSPFSKQFTQVIVFSVKEPSCEDTEQELKERVYRSALSAVDHEQIKQTFLVVRTPFILANQTSDSKARICLQANDWKRTRLLKTTSQSGKPTSPLLLLEIPPTASLPMPWINPRLDVPPKPSPHQLPIKAVCCPIVFTAPPHRRDSRERKGKRRRGKPKNKNKLVP